MVQDNIDHLISLIFSSGRLIRKRIQIEKKFSPLQILTLHYVKEHRNTSMKDIASFLRITPSSTTSLINELVKSHKLKRVSDNKDRRLIRIAITPQGETILDAIFKKAKIKMQNTFSKLQSREIRSLIRILEKICSNDSQKKLKNKINL